MDDELVRLRREIERDPDDLSARGRYANTLRRLGEKYKAAVVAGGKNARERTHARNSNGWSVFYIPHGGAGRYITGTLTARAEFDGRWVDALLGLDFEVDDDLKVTWSMGYPQSIIFTWFEGWADEEEEELRNIAEAMAGADQPET